MWNTHGTQGQLSIEECVAVVVVVRDICTPTAARAPCGCGTQLFSKKKEKGLIYPFARGLEPLITYLGLGRTPVLTTTAVEVASRRCRRKNKEAETIYLVLGTLKTAHARQNYPGACATGGKREVNKRNADWCSCNSSSPLIYIYRLPR